MFLNEICMCSKHLANCVLTVVFLKTDSKRRFLDLLFKQIFFVQE